MDRSLYRNWVKGEGLVKVVVSHMETDLCILGDRDLSKEALGAIHKYRKDIEEYIKRNPAFRESLEPLGVQGEAPDIVKSMIKAGKAAGVGPMAAVAGAVAEYVGRDLLEFSDEIIVENGGDIFIKSLRDRSFGLFAGESPLTGKLKFEIMAEDTPLGVCTSSGTVGHSLSFGAADAVSVISKDTALADAVATKTGNIVTDEKKIEEGIAFARSVKGILGVIVVVKDRLGSWGKIRLGE